MNPGLRRLAAVVLLGLLAAALYLVLGQPARVLPEERTAAAAREAFVPALTQYLRRHPRDERAWVLLARALAADEHYGEAAQAYERAVTFPKVARDARVWADYADALGMAQGGRLAGKPLELVARALALDPQQPQALDLAGSAAYERGDFATAAQYWRALLAQLPPDSGQARELLAALERTQRLARVSLRPTT